MDMRRDWPLLTAYQRFESVVAFVLTLVIAAVIAVALYLLIISVASTLVLRTLNPLDHTVFQVVFGDIMTVLIALEFNHTLQYVITRQFGPGQDRDPDCAPGAGEKGDRHRPVRNRARNGRRAWSSRPVSRRNIPADTRWTRRQRQHGGEPTPRRCVK